MLFCQASDSNKDKKQIISGITRGLIVLDSLEDKSEIYRHLH